MKHRRTSPAVLAAAALLLAAPAAAQPVDRETRTNTNAWVALFGDIRLGARTALFTEAQLRREGPFARLQQWQGALGLTRDVGGARLTAGVTRNHTAPYGELPAALPFPEWRSWQQLALAQQTGRVAWAHRYRVEQRWLGNVAREAGGGDVRVDSWRRANRARYMLRATVPLRGPTLDDGEPYATAYDELFVGWGRNVQQNLLDQNRLFAGVGRRWGGGLRTEAGYLNHLVVKGNGRQIERNHTLLVAVFASGGRGGR